VTRYLPRRPPQADSDDLITLVKLVLSRMNDDETASFAAQLATLLDDLRCTLQPLTNNVGAK
jgi:hypothetical protein